MAQKHPQTVTMARECIGQLEVECTSAGVFIQAPTGDVIHIPNWDLRVMGDLLSHQAVNVKLAAAADPFVEPRSSRRLSADGDVLSGGER
ncbi:hypothetical protein [Methylobacterium oryzisoli]|uniref:hypothetical protein n=1 Tax=Methylobacterium oryzisoli TaxID=3385502 RepID=UPI00389151E3